MAPNATLYRLRVALSDVDRGVYQDLDVRLARHPSETAEYLMTRAVAYCLCHEEGLEFRGGGVSDADEPVMSVRDASGALTTWIDIGSPSADRMHRASKACPRVVVFTHHDPALLVKESERRAIHRRDQIEAYALDEKLVADLVASTERNARWELTRTEGDLYIKVGERTLSGRVERIALSP